MSKIDFGLFTNIQWRAELCSERSLLFYKLKPAGEEQFLERIKNQNFALCLVNSDKAFDDDRVQSLTFKDWMQMREEAADHFHPLSEDLKILGVTGTNGKTTTVDMIRQLCVLNSINVKTIGTLGVYENNKKTNDFSMTSPDYLDLRKELACFDGVAAIEISSHSLDQQRVGSLKLDSAGWTSFSQDHLDYHKTLEAYFQAKMKIFNYLKPSASCFIPETQSDLTAMVKHEAKKKSKNKVTKDNFLKPLYNQENLGVAYSMLSDCGFDIKEDFSLNPPPGRLNIFEFKNSLIVIDFAHTPEAIASLTSEMKKTFFEHKLITLFGCGGDRDRSKRPLMGRAASKYSDFIVLTSDNPRSEDPESIINDIVPGVNIPYRRESNRELAIIWAINEFCDENAVLLLAGKGHEEYIEIKGQKTFYSDENVVKKFIKENSDA